MGGGSSKPQGLSNEQLMLFMTQLNQRNNGLEAERSRLHQQQMMQQQAFFRERMELEQRKNEMDRQTYLRKMERLDEREKVTIDNHKKQQDKNYGEFLKMVEEIPPVEKTEKRSAAFLGKTSVGKSSMINKLFGANCQTSPLTCTKDVSEVWSSEDLVIFDVFGTNDEESYHNTKTLTTTKTLHLIVAVYTECVDSAFRFAMLLGALGVPVIFVRNKCEDLSADDQKLVHDNDLPKLQERCNSCEGLILASSRNGMGMDELKKVIEGKSE